MPRKPHLTNFTLTAISMIPFILSVTAAIFSIVNPLGAIPLYLSLTADYDLNHRRRVTVHMSLYTVGILLVFFWLGIHLLNFFGIDINALRIAGGLVILSSGYGLLSGKMEQSRSVDKQVRTESMEREDIAFTPMAMPMLAGPGSISYLINLYSSNEVFEDRISITIAILLVGVVVYIILIYSKYLYKLLGQAGLRALSRIMGFLVMAIGTQYMISGIVALVKSLTT
jgi:multiple antibiotic resistance protein